MIKLCFDMLVIEKLNNEDGEEIELKTSYPFAFEIEEDEINEFLTNFTETFKKTIEEDIENKTIDIQIISKELLD